MHEMPQPRAGGSYTWDPTTGTLTLVEATAPATRREADVSDAGAAPTAVAVAAQALGGTAAPPTSDAAPVASSIDPIAAEPMGSSAATDTTTTTTAGTRQKGR